MRRNWFGFRPWVFPCRFLICALSHSNRKSGTGVSPVNSRARCACHRSSTTHVRVATMTFSIMSKETAIRRIVPAAAIPGGEIAVEFDIRYGATPRVLIDGATAHVVADSNQRVLALVPSIQGGEAQVTLSFDDGEPSIIAPSRLVVGTKL